MRFFNNANLLFGGIELTCGSSEIVMGCSESSSGSGSSLPQRCDFSLPNLESLSGVKLSVKQSLANMATRTNFTMKSFIAKFN